MSMIKIARKLCLALGILLMISFTLTGERIKVYLIGDSTMSDKAIKAYPETGWGMPFAHFFNENVVVDNRAMNGRSTKSFMEENRWQPVVDSLKAGDYVFIQFGHNDESKTKKTYTPEDEYARLLTKYVLDSRSKRAIPVLVTPVSRRKFDESGKQIETHASYSEVVRNVAKQHQVPLVDLDKESQELYQKYGAENSKLLFLQLAAGEHPNYPEGKVDNTHFNELGARLIAQIVLADIRKLNLELADYIVKPVIKPAK